MCKWKKDLFCARCRTGVSETQSRSTLCPYCGARSITMKPRMDTIGIAYRMAWVGKWWQIWKGREKRYDPSVFHESLKG